MPLADPKTIGTRLHAKGWKTGSVLTPDHARAIAPFLQRSGQPPRRLTERDQLIVVSQTCDIVACELSVEPFIEVLVAQECNAVKRQIANLRSTRQLSFQAKPDGPILETHATDRFWIPREQFDGYAPDAKRSLTDKAASRLSAWLGLRYTRPAWPAALISRLPKRAQMEKVLRDVARAVTEIRVAIDHIDEELPEDRPYELTVYAVMDADIYDNDPNKREQCTRAFFRLLDLLRRCPGIRVNEESEVCSGRDFSWQMTQMTDLWNLANLTSAAEEV